MKNVKKRIRKISCIFLILLISNVVAYAQNGNVIKGIVVDSNNEPVIGATLVVKGHPSIGAIADLYGMFTLNVPNANSIVIVSYIGMTSREIKVTPNKQMKIVLEDDNIQLGEVVVVGYGQQKKASVVGAITQTTGSVLERAGGVSNVGMALTGNLPGVITTNSSGMPGDEDPEIVIRGSTSWNGSSPLVLVDGIERSMSTVDISSIENVSVLKDASATAVYGVKGANGVILITTKRGAEGKANIQIRANMTAKVVSKLPEKYDSYDSLMLLNETIERELGISPDGWADYTPKEIINKYRYPANSEEWDRYPNVDWQKELFKDYAMSYNLSANVSGGTKTVNYFSSVDYVHEGDLFKTVSNNRGYKAGYGYNRINVRSNLDFSLTKTTKFSTNLFGSNGVRKLPWIGANGSESDANYWSSAYLTAPDAMRPIYSDGTWGWYATSNADVPNSVYLLATSGVEKRTKTQINTDFILKQDLAMITKGLTLKADLSLDNTFVEYERGINDLYNSAQRMWVDPDTGEISYEQSTDSGTQLDYSDGISWTTESGSVNTGATYRKLYYSLQLNYDRQFGKHNVGAMGLFSREKNATGSEFSHYREDWVFRTTYNYAMKYFTEFNGAYNGSEKFSSKNRFAFFPSISGGWMVTEEKFMKPIKFLDMLKLRASWGKIGDDSAGDRWLYQTQWSYSGNAVMGDTPTDSPYTIYRISTLGNEDISWETVEKKNLGIDYSFLNGMLAGSVDIFRDKRTNILIDGDDRSIPSYFGTTAPSANLGIVKAKGYELELRFNHRFGNVRLWANTNMTHAVNKVIFRDDPELTPDYQKAAGYSLGQSYSYLDYGFLNSWDDVYGSTERETNNSNKIAGDYNIIDYNADGVIDSDDEVPYEYSTTPQNTYSATLGFEWKGFSAFVQFYGVNNVTREVTFPTFRASSHVAYAEGTYWTKDSGGDIPLPRWTTTVGDEAAGTRYMYDGSYVRLKNAEIAYTFKGGWINKLRVKSCRLYLNGNNLLLWTKMPDDRESNFSGSSTTGAYPTSRRFNLGIDITL